jgi:cytochrome c556
MLAAVGTSIPVIPLAMLCMFASGGLAVTLYRRRAGFQRVTPVMGAKLGILAGGLGFGVLSILSGVRLIASSERDELRVAFQQKMQDAMSTSADPQVRQAMEEFRNYIATDHGLILMVLLFLAIAAVVFLVFAALGGVLGAVLFGRDGARRQP